MGKGAGATARIARHKATNALYCLKTIKRRTIEANLDKFITSFKIQMYLDHPNVAKVYGLIVCKQEVHLVMEYCVEGDLASSLYEFRQPKKSKEVLRGITRGLKYLHDRRIHHRDLKLENVLINCGVPKITDF